MVNILQVSEKTASDFAKGDREAYHEIGMKQGIPYGRDTRKFWEEVSKLFPGEYTKEDLGWLVARGDIDGPLSFLFDLDPPLKEESPVLRRLAVNAHAYK